MARKRDRAFAMFFAILFIVTSSALTIGVLVQSYQDRHPATVQQAQQTKPTNRAQPKEKKVDNSAKLEGKPLANFTPLPSITALEEQDTTLGTGDAVKASDTITVDYTGAVASTGIVFQSSKDTGQPVSFPLNQVIAGWTQGIPGMKVGGTRRLLIPATLAYGAHPPSGSNIPANADLVFDVTVYKIGK